LLLAAANLFGPWTAQVYSSKGVGELWRLVLKAIAVVTIVSVGFVAVVGLLRETLLVTFFGDDYAGQGFVVLVLAFCTGFWGVSTLVTPALATMRKTSHAFIATLVGLLITLLVGIPWIIIDGAVGAAGTMLVASVADATIRFVLFWRSVRQETALLGGAS
jgi:O-antigen/teichoic acid export membrane protein